MRITKLNYFLAYSGLSSMKKLFPFLVLVILSVACSKEKKDIVDVSGIPAEVEVVRFEKQFYTAGPEQLQALKTEFPYLFPEGTADADWIAKMQDKDERELFEATQQVFGDFNDVTTELVGLFKHIKYYFPKFKVPKVLTLTSNVDYENRVLVNDTLVLVSLDCYLGSGNKIYADYPNYIKQQFQKERLVVDVAKAYALRFVPLNRDRSFVARMVQEGKITELVHRFLPEKPDHVIMGYTPEQLKWAEIYESDMWKYFIEKQLLFSSDMELSKRFILDAPFSKFYLANDRETPGRIGVWFGWRIVRSYLNHHDTGLKEMLAKPNDLLFKKSKYKPGKS